MHIRISDGHAQHGTGHMGHFTLHEIGDGLILATRLGARKPSCPCVSQDLQELNLDSGNINLWFSLASTVSYDGRPCYGYLWKPCSNRRPPVVTRLSNLPSNPHDRCEHDLTHVSSDDKVLRDLRSFFAPRRVFTARSAWERLRGASVEIWSPSKPVGDDCTQEIYDAGNMDAYAERKLFVEVLLQELWSPIGCPGADNVFVGFDPFMDNWMAVANYCDEIHL